MRMLLTACGCCVALLVGPNVLHAQTYPNKSVRFILPFPPGGGTDILGRTLAQKLGDSLGQNVIPENRPGAGGNLGAEYAARQLPDGYTIVLGGPSLAISPSLYKKLAYDPVKDLVPISRIASVPNLLMVHPSVPARSLNDLATLARRQPGKLNFGTGGAGTSNDLAARYFIAGNKLKIEIIPHKGASQAQTALLSGDVDAVVIGIAAAATHVRTGRLRALAVLGDQRDNGVPDVPTVVEAGMPWFQIDTWYGVLAPAGTPRAIIQKLNAEFVKILNDPELRKQLAARGTNPVTSTPEEFGQFIRSEIERWGKVARASGAAVIE